MRLGKMYRDCFVSAPRRVRRLRKSTRHGAARADRDDLGFCGRPKRAESNAAPIEVGGLWSLHRLVGKAVLPATFVFDLRLDEDSPGCLFWWSVVGKAFSNGPRAFCRQDVPGGT